MNPRRMNGARWTVATLGMAACLTLLSLFWIEAARAASAEEIDRKVDLALDRLKDETRGGIEFFKAKGVLIFPRVLKAGFIVGGEYGVGALRIDGKTVDYYSLASGSVGFQVGAQQRDVVIIFRDDVSLKKFRASSGWKVGGDGSLTVTMIGMEGCVDTMNMSDSVMVYTFGHRGLMVNVSLEGAKLTKLKYE